MTKKTRALVWTPDDNRRLIAYTCKGCRWGVSVEYSGGEMPGQAAQAAFDAHNCEDNPIGEDSVKAM
jgi:hypothetical protein